MRPSVKPASSAPTSQDPNCAEFDFIETRCLDTVFANVDLALASGLDSAIHEGPSWIGLDTLLGAQGKIPEAFLRGCGVPESLIQSLPLILKSIEPIQFYTCFISYSSKDEEFAKRLHSKMRNAGLRVWFAPEDIEGGKKIHEQVERAIQDHDRLLLVLSEHSIDSQWVRDEIRRARKAEVMQGRRKLFPIALVPFESLSVWESFYADLAEDLAEEVREYYVPDFSNWKDSDFFEAAFDKLLRDVKKNAGEATSA